MSRFGRGLAGWWEVMRSECSGLFGSGRGWWLARCGASRQWCSVRFILRKKKAGRGPCGSERRGAVGWAGREAEAQWGGGERASWGARQVAVAGPKTRAGPKFKK
jgi:hypothetical protein